MDKTPQPGQFLQHKLDNQLFSRNALVILDLDDTTITTHEGQWLGRSEMFYYLVDKELKLSPGKNRQQVINEIDPLLSLVYSKVPVQLTDKMLPETIDRLTSKGVFVIGMTARGLPTADVTRFQLKETGVTFLDTGPMQAIALPEDRQFMAEHGVVLVGQGNQKGEALIALLKNNVIPKPDQIILVDDHYRHLNSVQQAVTQYDSGIRYVPVQCTYLEDKKRFDPAESEQQLLDFLYRWRKDKPFSDFVRQDAFSQRFIARCKDVAAKASHCKALLQHFCIKP